MFDAPHIVFAGGGALGNIYPGLAIAKRLNEQMPRAQITFAGGGKPIERHTVRAAGYNYAATPCKPMPQGPMEAFRFVTDNFAGFFSSRWMLKEQNASLVVGMGGYSSAGVVRAAHGRGVPFVLLEQNAIPSRTTKWMAAAAEVVCLAFESAQSHLSVEARTVVTGTPGRPAFETLYEQEQRHGDGRAWQEMPGRERRLVIVGGAGGARSLNEQMPATLKRLQDRLIGWRIIHQTGEGQLQATEQRYVEAGIDALVVSHIDEMASLLFETDLVICRAGGTMLAELALAGAPAILTPYLSGPSVGGQANYQESGQMANAEIFSQAGACRLVDEIAAGDRFVDKMASELGLLLADDTERRQMSDTIRQFAQPNAADKIADVCCEILGSGQMRLAA